MTVGPAAHTQSVQRETGVAEGRVCSPLLFVLHAASLFSDLRALRDGQRRTVGVEVGGEWVGAVMFMDDVLVMAESAAHLRQLVGGVLGWCARNRHELEMDKSAAMVVRKGRPVPESEMRWWMDVDGREVAQGAPGARESLVKFSPQVKYLGVVLDAGLSWVPHVRKVRQAAGVVPRDMWASRRALGGPCSGGRCSWRGRCGRVAR
jgi:hypothetical protein